MEKKRQIEVVAAIITNNNKVFATQRGLQRKIDNVW